MKSKKYDYIQRLINEIETYVCDQSDAYAEIVMNNNFANIRSILSELLETVYKQQNAMREILAHISFEEEAFDEEELHG